MIRGGWLKEIEGRGGERGGGELLPGVFCMAVTLRCTVGAAGRAAYLALDYSHQGSSV